MGYETTPILHTERLILRKFEENDVVALFELLSDVEVNTFLPWFPVKSLEEAKLFLHKRFLDENDTPYSFRYAICPKQNNRPIGYVCCSNDKSYDFGYALKKEAWKKGIVTEASKAVIEQIKIAGYPYITATHDVKNGGSGAVMKKLGMIYQYSYVEQWAPKDSSVTFRMYQLNFDGNTHSPYMEYWDRYEPHFVERT